MSSEDKNKKLFNTWILKDFFSIPRLVWIAVVIYLVPIVFLKVKLGGPSESMSQWGLFGDFVGGSVNPLFGLITIVLLVYTLKQNDLALQQAAEELTQTRDALSRGQAIQAATEEALRQQIAIASSEKDFNSTLQLSAAFQDQIDEVNKILNASVRPSSESAVNLRAVQSTYLRKRQELFELAEMGYESLVERMLNENIRQKTLLTGVLNGRFDFTVRYDIDEGRAEAKFVDLQNNAGYSIVFEKAPGNLPILMRRLNSIYQAKAQLTEAINYFVEHGSWGAFKVERFTSDRKSSE